MDCYNALAPATEHCVGDHASLVDTKSLNRQRPQSAELLLVSAVYVEVSHRLTGVLVLSDRHVLLQPIK